MGQVAGIPARPDVCDGTKYVARREDLERILEGLDNEDSDSPHLEEPSRYNISLTRLHMWIGSSHLDGFTPNSSACPTQRRICSNDWSNSSQTFLIVLGILAALTLAACGHTAAPGFWTGPPVTRVSASTSAARPAPIRPTLDVCQAALNEDPEDSDDAVAEAEQPATGQHAAAAALTADTVIVEPAAAPISATGGAAGNARPATTSHCVRLHARSSRSTRQHGRRSFGTGAWRRRPAARSPRLPRAHNGLTRSR